ncbi:MAG: WGxxGxxG family protein [Trueperaceae bacterium]
MDKLRKRLMTLALAVLLVFGAGSGAWAQDQLTPAPGAQVEDDDGFDWGWLGLLGLIGLAGLAGRKRDNDTVARTDTTRRDR